jgi:hypothetical protein
MCAIVLIKKDANSRHLEHFKGIVRKEYFIGLEQTKQTRICVCSFLQNIHLHQKDGKPKRMLG